MASIEINGVDELIKKLGKATANKTLRPPMARALGDIKRDMSRYPQPISDSPYVRTNKLEQAWHTPSVESIKHVAGGTVGRVGTNLKYAPFVQSHLFQVTIHRYRWPTDQDVLDKNRKAIVADFERAIEKALK